MLVISYANQLYLSGKFWVGENLSIINQWGNHKKKGGGSNFEISVGGSKNRGEGDTIFDSNLVGGILEETMVFDTSNMFCMGIFKQRMKYLQWEKNCHVFM